MQLVAVKIDKPEAINFILGQTHFIKSVEDIHEALVGAVPGIKFGVAFCEASGKCLIRWSGTDPDMIELAQKNAEGDLGRPFDSSSSWPRAFTRSTCSARSRWCRKSAESSVLPPTLPRLSSRKPNKAGGSLAWWTDCGRRASRTRAK